MELVSVILPVYNGERYLKECIDSILASTYQNLEIILIDDGSTDRSGPICDEYAERDSRIKVIHQENRGLICARNCGLSVSNGTYIAFVDADDLVSPAFYEEMVSAIEAEHADLVACEYRHNKEDVVNRIAPSEKKLVSVQTFEEQLAILTCAPSIRGITWTGPFVWNKLYRKEKITERFNKECLMCEDLRFNYDYLQACEKMTVLPVGLYFYRIHEESIAGRYRKRKTNVRNGISNAMLWAYIACHSQVADPGLKDYLEARAAYTAHGALWRVYASGAEMEHREFTMEAHSLICSHCLQLLRDKETYNIKVRTVIWLCCHISPLWKSAARLSAKCSISM